MAANHPVPVVPVPIAPHRKLPDPKRPTFGRSQARRASLKADGLQPTDLPVVPAFIWHSYRKLQGAGAIGKKARAVIKLYHHLALAVPDNTLHGFPAQNRGCPRRFVVQSHAETISIDGTAFHPIVDIRERLGPHRKLPICYAGAERPKALEGGPPQIRR